MLIDPGELRSVLSSLSHELCRPLISLKAGFDLLLDESSTTFTPDQRGHLLTMVSLCDDLLRLTRSYLDYAGIVQGSRPLCLGSFTIGALIHEIDRQFAPIACHATGPLGGPCRIAGDRGGHRRLALPADRRQPGLERPEVHPDGRHGARYW